MGKIAYAKRSIENNSTGKNINNMKKFKITGIKDIFTLVNPLNNDKYNFTKNQLHFARNLRIGVFSISLLASVIGLGSTGANSINNDSSYQYETEYNSEILIKESILNDAENALRRAAYPEDKDYDLSKIVYIENKDLPYTTIQMQKRIVKQSDIYDTKFTYNETIKNNSPEELLNLCQEITKIRSLEQPTQEQLIKLKEAIKAVQNMSLTLEDGRFLDSSKQTDYDER